MSALNDEILDTLLACVREALDDARTNPRLREPLTRRAHDIYFAVRHVARLKRNVYLPPFDQWRREAA